MVTVTAKRRSGKGESGLSFAKISIEGPDRYLRVGLKLSIAPLLKPSAELAATVTQISADQIDFELLRSTSERSFREGDRVRVKYWEDAVYYFDSQILTVSGSADEKVAVSRPAEGISVQRRKTARVRVAIPFSFTVITAKETELIGEIVHDCQTQNISLGGLKFETSLPLALGDRLEIDLHLTPSQFVNAVGWVVRSETVEHDGKSLHSVAMEFLQLDGEEQNQLLLFLLNCLSDP
jgi:c-di-GMP-binding flagellar brake protein YcgR